MKHFCLAYAILFTVVFLAAPDRLAAQSSFEKIAEEADKSTKKNISLDSILKEMTNPPVVLSTDSMSIIKYNEALKAYYDYRIFGFKHRQQVFHWQLISTNVIFIIVNLLVASGIFFSWLQFRKGLKIEGNNTLPETEVELSITNVKVKSSIIGVLILVISLVFFYLYLVYIYPINEIF